MSYTYEKVSASDNKKDQMIYDFRVINEAAKSQVYLNQGVSFN